MPNAGTLPFGRLDRRRAFISGGAKGIGAAIVQAFAAAGADVIIGDLDIASAADLAGQVGATAAQLDVTDAACNVVHSASTSGLRLTALCWPVICD